MKKLSDLDRQNVGSLVDATAAWEFFGAGFVLHANFRSADGFFEDHRVPLGHHDAAIRAEVARLAGMQLVPVIVHRDQEQTLHAFRLVANGDVQWVAVVAPVTM